jgi:hypothetical protein
MAFPVVASVTESVDLDGPIHAVAMPATVDDGDLLVMKFLNDDDDQPNTPTGWTLLFSENAGLNTIQLTVFYRFADGTEGGTTVDVNIVSGESSAAQTYRITGWHGTTAPEAGVATTGTSTSPDPPSLAPSWGAEDTLWLAVAGIKVSDNDITAGPTSYTDFIDTNAGAGGGSVEIGTGRRERNGSPEDPDAFTVATSAIWIANVVVIRPAAAADPAEENRLRSSFVPLLPLVLLPADPGSVILDVHKQQVAGIYSGVEIGVAVDVFLDGTIAAASSLTGDLPVDREMAAVVAAVSALAGVLPVDREMVSTVAVVSTLAGDLPVDREMISAIAASSTLAGELILTGEQLLDGVIAASSTLAGELPVNREMISTIAAAAALAGELPVDRLMVSTVAATSTLAGDLPISREMVAVVPATSSLAGALELEWALAGTISGVSALDGELTLAGEQLLSGVIAAISALTGQLPVERLMASTVAAASTLDAILGKYRAINGSIDVASTLAGELQRLRALTGAVAGGSTLAGVLELKWALRGVVAGLATVSGDLSVDLGFPWTRERILGAADLPVPHREEII